jgi:hypothetical protein
MHKKFPGVPQNISSAKGYRGKIKFGNTGVDHVGSNYKMTDEQLIRRNLDGRRNGLIVKLFLNFLRRNEEKHD